MLEMFFKRTRNLTPCFFRLSITIYLTLKSFFYPLLSLNFINYDFYQCLASPTKVSLVLDLVGFVCVFL